MFKDSQHNWMLQLVDIVAYALKGQYRSFGQLAEFPQQDLLPILKNKLVLAANTDHPLGVVEP